MHELLEFFNLQDFIPLVLLIWLLEFVGNQMGGDDAASRWWARGFAGAGFLIYVAFGIDAFHPTRAADFLVLGIRALLAMGMVHGLAVVVVPIIRFLYKHLWAEPMAKQKAREEERKRSEDAKEAAREQQRQQQAEQERRDEERRRQREEEARRPPPPTREEKFEAAKQRFDKAIRSLNAADLDDIELKAAQEKAKQQYLRDLDGAMK